MAKPLNVLSKPHPFKAVLFTGDLDAEGLEHIGLLEDPPPGEFMFPGACTNYTVLRGYYIITDEEGYFIDSIPSAEFDRYYEVVEDQANGDTSAG